MQQDLLEFRVRTCTPQSSMLSQRSPRRGPFTPPDLRATATRVANGFKDCLRDVVSSGRLPNRPERTAACEKTDVAMRALADEWQSVFGGWIEKRMAEYEDSLRRIADGGASPLRAGPAEPPPRALNTGRPSV